jgi:hypothetical protein
MRRRKPPKKKPKDIFSKDVSKNWSKMSWSERNRINRLRANKVAREIYGTNDRNDYRDVRYEKIRNTSLIEDHLIHEEGNEKIEVSLDEKKLLWRIDGFEIVRIKGNEKSSDRIRLKPYREENGIRQPYPLIDIRGWNTEEESNTNWHEISLARVDLRITKDWQQLGYMDILNLEKDEIGIKILHRVPNQLKFEEFRSKIHDI